MAKKTPGMPPGTLVFTGERRADRVLLRVLDYSADALEEREPGGIEEVFPYRDAPTVSWINIDGLHDVGVLDKLGAHFGIHPLLVEDILNTNQRPKFEEHDQCLFLTLRMLRYDASAGSIDNEQVSFVLVGNCLLSFQERPGDCFDAVRDRLRTGRSRIRSAGADYLLYALVDAVVDHSFALLEGLGERVEALEDRLLEHPTPESLEEIYDLKRELLLLRKSVWPLREVIHNLERSDSTLIRQSTHVFLRDVYDHTIQVIDTVESLRDSASSMLDVYLSSISNKTNDVMKMLTMIATIFIPLSFLCGLYGMNFEYMPELHYRWGYPALLGLMLLVGGGLLVYFKRRNWL